jgi:hypothetical protein
VFACFNLLAVDSIPRYFWFAMRLFLFSKLSDCLFAVGLYANISSMF